MRALVTGGGGFLGRAIVERLLERGMAVNVLGRSPQPELESMGVQMFQGSLLDAALVDRATRTCDVVFHVAAKAGVWGSYASYYEPNVLGTRSVITACQKNKVSRLVHTSTPSVVYNGRPFRGEDESLPYGYPKECPYAATKAIAEEEVLAANGSNGLSTVALRPHLIWGPRDPHLVPRIVERAQAGKLKMVGDGLNKVDVTYIDNAVQAHILAFEALGDGCASGKAYFISQGEPVLLWEWINALLLKLGKTQVTRRISLNKAYIAGSVLETLYRILNIQKEPLMTRFVATELAKDHYYSIARARKDLGYSPEVSTEEGLERLARWYNA